MRIYTNVVDMVMEWEQKEELYGKGLKEIHKLMVDESYKDYMSALSGNIPTAEFRRAGHPFARTKGTRMRGTRASYKFNTLGIHHGVRVRTPDPRIKKFSNQITPSGEFKKLPINKQTEELIRSVQLVHKGGDKETYDLFPTSSHQAVLTPGGTPKMVDRQFFGPFGVIRKFHKARLQGLVQLNRRLNKRLFP